jgi:FMN phosphatase YigB (HAD superfamily)
VPPRLVISPAIKVYSFDVFDTSLVRRIASPNDAFALVAHLVARKNGESVSQEWVQDFVAARIEARRRAVAASRGRECTLEQIWDCLHELLGYLPETCGPECELAVERDLLVANHWVACTIAELRARDARIVFMTDTYLPEEFIRSELIRHKLAKEGDGFYVSSAVGVRKDTDGRLFEILLKEENVAAREVHHWGDNLLVDVRIPKQLGINATWFTGSRLNAWESAIAERRSTARQPAARLAGAMRAARLSAPYSPHSGVDDLVSSFLGPALTIWAAWLLGAAQRDKISRLYFCSRDCYLLWRAARVLAPHFDNLDCRYLKISRRAVFVPSGLEISPAGMPWVGDPEDPAPLRQIVRRAGLDWDEVAEAFFAIAGQDGGDKVLPTQDEWDAFWDVLRTPRVRTLIEHRIRTCSESAIAYFQYQGLLDPIDAAVVDLGWTASTLAAVHRILHQREADPYLRGYYLCLHLQRKIFASPGRIKALFYEETSGKTSVIQHRAYVLREVFGLAPHGTVIEYRISGTRPKARCADVPGAHAVLVEEIAKAVEAFCVEQAPNVMDYVEDVNARSLLEALIEAWCAAPHQGALCVVEEGCGSARDHSDEMFPHPAALIEPWRLAESIKYLIPGRWRRRLGVPVRNGLWPEASLLCSRRLPATLVRLRETAAMALRRQ